MMTEKDTEDTIRQVKEEAYNEGYDIGKQEGWTKGYEEGIKKQNAYFNGVNEGHSVERKNAMMYANHLIEKIMHPSESDYLNCSSLSEAKQKMKELVLFYFKNYFEEGQNLEECDCCKMIVERDKGEFTGCVDQFYCNSCIEQKKIQHDKEAKQDES